MEDTENAIKYTESSIEAALKCISVNTFHLKNII